jgi:hypothetical protein
MVHSFSCEEPHGGSDLKDLSRQGPSRAAQAKLTRKGKRNRGGVKGRSPHPFPKGKEKHPGQRSSDDPGAGEGSE